MVTNLLITPGRVGALGTVAVSLVGLHTLIHNPRAAAAWLSLPLLHAAAAVGEVLAGDPGAHDGGWWSV
jgi:hypothetical protein